MRAAILISSSILVFSSCTTNKGLVGQPFVSPSEMSASIEQRWTLAALHSHCTSERRQPTVPLTQPPIVFLESNRHGELTIGHDDDAYLIRWSAVVIKGRVEAYESVACRGEHYWFLDTCINPDLPRDPQVLRRLAEEEPAGDWMRKEPHQSAQPLLPTGG